MHRFTRSSVGRWGAQLLAGTGVVMALSAAPAAAQFAVYPIVLNLDPAEGAEAVSSVWVRNDAATAREFRFEMQDFDQDSIGTPRFLAMGEHTNSCAGRIEVYPQAATIAPGETRELTVRVKGANAVCWAALFTEARTVQPNGIVARQQIGVRINVRPPGVLPEGEITRLQADTAAGGTLHVWFSNTGAVPVRPSGTVEVRDAAGATVSSIRVEPFSVLPGGTRRIPVALDQRLAAGRYTLVPVFDFGGDYLAGGQTTLTVR